MRTYGWISRRLPGLSFVSKITLAGLLTVHLPLLAVVLLAVLDPGLGAAWISSIAITVAALSAIAMVMVMRGLLAPMQTAARHISDYLAHRRLPPEVAVGGDAAGRLLKDVFVLCALIERQQFVMETLALQDPLTGINNRRGGAALLLRSGGPDRDRRQPLSVGMIDVDDLHEINAEGGHALGDQGLRRVARELVSVLRVDDFVARWGGDEFLAVCHRTESDMLIAMDRVRAAVGHPRREETSDLGIRVSIGVAQLLPPESLEACIARADVALYEAKRNGGNQVRAAP